MCESRERRITRPWTPERGFFSGKDVLLIGEIVGTDAWDTGTFGQQRVVCRMAEEREGGGLRGGEIEDGWRDLFEKFAEDL